MTTIDLSDVRAVIVAAELDSAASGVERVSADQDRPAADLHRRLQLRGVCRLEELCQAALRKAARLACNWAAEL